MVDKSAGDGLNKWCTVHRSALLAPLHFSENDSADNDDVAAFAGSGYQELGGLLRSSLRFLIRSIGSSGVGSFPVHPRTILKSTEKLGDLLDFRKEWNAAKETHGVPHSSVPLTERLKKFSIIVGTAVPGFVKNTLCGTAVFGAYDFISSTNPSAVNDWRVSFLSGAAGGALHFSVFSGWDLLQRQLNFMRTTKSFTLLAPSLHAFQYSLHGTFFAHTLIHGVLFCMYESSKQFVDTYIAADIEDFINEERAKIRQAMNPDKTQHTKTQLAMGSGIGGGGHGASHGAHGNARSHSGSHERSASNRDNAVNDVMTTDAPETPPDAVAAKIHTATRILSSGLAGAVAGTICDGFSHFLEPIEKYGFRKGFWKVIKTHPPPLRALYSAIIPSSIGFIAYELGKDEEE